MLVPRRKVVRVLLTAAAGGASGWTLLRSRVARADDAEPPRAVAPEPQRDAGILAPGETAVATFTIENRGGAPLGLVARNPRPYVSGVKVDVKGAPVAPGASATVTVTVDTSGLSGPGEVRIPIDTGAADARQGPGSVSSSDEVMLVLKLEVRPLLAADPGYVRYNVVQHEREGTIVQTVWAVDGKPFRVLGVDSPSKDLRVTFRETTKAERRAEPGSQWRVQSTLASDAAVGALSGNLVVRTDHPRQKLLHVPVSGFVRPVLAVTPPEANLGEIDGARPFRFTLDVKSFSTDEVTVERATCDLANATVEVLPVKQGRAYKVRVGVPAGLPAGPVAGTLQIFTSSTAVPRIDVPVRGRIRSADAPAAAE